MGKPTPNVVASIYGDRVIRRELENQGASMSKPQSPRYSAQTPFQSSSSAVLDSPFAGRQGAGGQVMVQHPRARAQQFAPEQIWGQYNNYRSNGLVGSAIVHVVLLALILGGATFGHHVVQQAKQREIVTLIAPSPDTYALPTAKKVVSGGGGGRDHDPLPAPPGRLPHFAMQQITPPQIVMRNEKPKLTAEPTVVVPPQVHMAENRMLNLGSPSSAPLPAAPPSNGTGSGGGIGSGSGGGGGVGHGPGVGPGSGGGIGGAAFQGGGGILAAPAGSKS